MLKKLIAGVVGIMLLAQLANGATLIVGTGDYVVKVEHPSYAPNSGPRILVDDAHNNYSTSDNRFKGFVDLMLADGERVTPLRTPITAEALAGVDVFVTCNALNEKNADNKWTLPTPSAFTDEEIKLVQKWVKAGGSLLLIADHMPFPGGSEKLAYAFGAIMENAFLFAPNFTYKPGDMNLLKFSRHPVDANDSLLHRHPVTMGRNSRERIEYVTDFTGHAFRMKPGLRFSPIMEVNANTNMLWPSDANVMTETTPASLGEGLFQGVVLRHGKGRVGIFAEAAMFSVAYADWNDNYPMGFQNKDAPYNQQFILNLVHWLSHAHTGTKKAAAQH